MLQKFNKMKNKLIYAEMVKVLEERREKIMWYNPPPLDQWESDTLHNAVEKPVTTQLWMKT
jgi:hypothetical protein